MLKLTNISDSTTHTDGNNCVNSMISISPERNYTKVYRSWNIYFRFLHNVFVTLVS